MSTQARAEARPRGGPCRHSPKCWARLSLQPAAADVACEGRARPGSGLSPAGCAPHLQLINWGAKVSRHRGQGASERGGQAEGPQEPAEAWPKNSLALCCAPRSLPPSLRGQLVKAASLSYYGAGPGQAGRRFLQQRPGWAAGEAGAPRQEWREAGAEEPPTCSLQLQLGSRASLGTAGLWSKFSWAPRERQRLCLARTILT